MNDIKAKLDEAIPTEAIATREAFKNGPQLSYLSGAYVINRLNAVLGQGNWGYEIKALTKVFEGTVAQYSGDVATTSYIAHIRFWYNITDKVTGRSFFEEVGYGDGTDKKNPGKAHELATKEAITDALKRAAKNLGMSFGLQLYFKEGQYVGEELLDSTAKEVLQKVNANDELVKSGKSAVAKQVSPKILKDQIKNAFAILQDQKKITKEAFVTDYLKGAKTDDLSDDMVTEVLGKIKQNFPQLGL